MADCLDGFARLAAANGDEWRAGRLWGAAERLRETRGRRPIRADLPPPIVPDAGVEEGRAMTPEDRRRGARAGGGSELELGTDQGRLRVIPDGQASRAKPSWNP